jgi:predicted ribosomally synthesized peptide with SipW-like signal peptide
MNRKILMSIGAIVFVTALSLGATGAFFSDSERSTGNTLTAGELDLKVDNSSYGFDWNNPDVVNPTGEWIKNEFNSWQLSDLTNQLFFRFDDLKPGDYGEDTISLHVQNDAWACMDIALTGTPENTVNGPETKFPDLTVGPNEGELQNFLNFAFWRDDGDNVYEVDEGPLLYNGTIDELNATTTIALADISTGQGPLLASTTATYIGKLWCFGQITPTPVAQEENEDGPTAGHTGFTCTHLNPQDNIAQTDGVVLDIGFTAVQRRHNSDFRCVPNGGPQGPTTATTTIDKIVQFSNLSIVGVDVSDFQLHINGPGGDQILTDEVALGGLAPGVYTVSEIYSGDPADVTFDAAFSGACSEIPVNTNTGTMTLVAGDDVTCTITNTVSTTTPS